MRLISRRELRFAQINIFDRCEDIRFLIYLRCLFVNINPPKKINDVLSSKDNHTAGSSGYAAGSIHSCYMVWQHAVQFKYRMPIM
jgi:hypothetical protein